MNKTELIKAIAEKGNINRNEAAKQLNNVLAAISENLREQKEIDIPSFGRFYIKRVEERQGINPATKQQITIPAHDKVVFKPYKPMLYYAEKY